MDKAKLEKFKKKLQEAKVEILKELELEREYVNYNDQGDLVDLADAVIKNEVLSRLSDMDVDKLKQIDMALEKIEKGTGYGVCEGNGKKIPEARLNHIPWARYTIEYAEQMEKSRR